MTMPKLRILAALVAGSAVLATAGCGNLTPTRGAVAGTTDRPHLTRTDFAAVVDTATRAAGSVHTVRTESEKDRKVVVTGDVSFLRQYQGRVREKLPSGAVAEIRVVNHVMYAYMPGVVPVGKFTSADLRLRRNASLAGLCTCVFELLEPRTMLAHMRKSLMQVDYLGMEETRGSYLDHYRLVADVRLIPGGPADIAQGAPRTRTYDIWLDSEHLISRMKYSEPSYAVDVTYSDWGRRIDVDPPWPKQIVGASRT